MGTARPGWSGAGGVYWAECDDLELTNFVERGVIVIGYQAEAAFIYLKSNDIDGDIIHLTYHPNDTFPSESYQQTRLLTCTGGLLHTATWTDRGKVLGLISPPGTENHTGYLIVETLGASSLVGIHTTKGSTTTPSPPNRQGKSTDTDGRAYTRISSDLDMTSYMPYKRYQHHMGGKFFDRGGTQYLVTRQLTYDNDFENQRLSIFGCDGDYVVTSFIGNISIPDGGNGIRTANYYLDGDTLHIYYNTATKTEIFHTTWNLTNLD